MGESEGRVFLRGIVSEKYALDQIREEQRAAPRVRGNEVVVDDASVAHSGDSKDSKTWWRIGPGDEPFLTQNLQVHFVEIPAGKSNHGHGHQNEAVFYILEGSGYEIHDDQKYPWKQGDVVIVHTDSVHRHFNDGDVKAKALVMKAKSTWMYFGLLQQGRSGPIENEDEYGPREDWSRIWTPGVEDKKKVLSEDDAEWELTPDGWIRHRLNKDIDARAFSVDIYEQKIPVGSRSGKHWHMSDEVLYVISGSGRSLQWDVQHEIAERFYARIKKDPVVAEFNADDTIYVPQNTVHQFENTGDEPLILLSAQNRLIKYLGYDKTEVLEPAPEYEAEHAVGAGA
ncbi:MAG: cupin domain-containing protein [Actinobacteria bacterium]|nr:cupin domain-containing protein [Actinomycetota bacterium]